MVDVETGYIEEIKDDHFIMNTCVTYISVYFHNIATIFLTWRVIQLGKYAEHILL